MPTVALIGIPLSIDTDVLIPDKWDEITRRAEEIIIEKQLPINERSRDALVQVRMLIFKADSAALANQVYSGGISIGQWEEQMRSLIRGMHTSSAVIAKGGWDNMTQADWGRVGSVVKPQYKYLHNFAETLEAQKDTISLNEIIRRSNMYGEAGTLSGIKVEAGDVIANKLPWLPKDGSTECLVNCKCRWELKVIAQKGDWKTVEAVWRLGEAEHCLDCVDRDGYITRFQVHRTVDVPATLGTPG